MAGNDEPVGKVGEVGEGKAIAAHVVPFVAWLLLMQFLDLPQLPTSIAYALRTAIGVILLLHFRPWTWYAAPRLRHLPLALLVGVGVFVAWVGLETAAFGRLAPELQELYQRWGVRPLGDLREPLAKLPYAPETCGWPLALIRLAGSAFVIASIEEFFWRGFLYRWMTGKQFLTVDPGHFDRTMFLLVALIFGLEHAEWLAGIVAGLAYGWIYLRTRDLWAAIIAHVVTNFLLGLYVLWTGAYWYW